MYVGFFYWQEKSCIRNVIKNSPRENYKEKKNLNLFFSLWQSQGEKKLL